MPTPEQVILGYNDAVYMVRSRVEAFAEAAWRNAGSWRDSDIDRLVKIITPRVMAGQVKTAQLTSAYLASLETVRTGVRVTPVPVSRAGVTEVRGVAVEEVYRRPAIEMYTKLSEGNSLPMALDAGLARLGSLVATDHQLAKTHQARSSLRGRGFKYMVRTLTGRENCAMCAIASTQRYSVQDLLPIHPGCDCGVDTLEADVDPGQVVDPDRLEMIHGAIESQFGGTDRGARMLDGRNERSDYLDLIITQEHGEYGPTLTWRDQHFTSKRELRAH